MPGGPCPGGDGSQERRRAPGQGPSTRSRAGRGLGERLAPDPVSALVDLAGQVRVETSEHAQRRGVLVRGADGSQGLWHGPGRASDDGSVLRVGLGAARCQVGDASHGQSGQVVHGDAHVLGHRHGQGPWWWRAGRPPPAGSHDRPASCTEHAGAPRRWVGPCRGPSAPPGSGPWPSARSLLTPGADEDLDVLDIHLSCRLSLRGCGASRWATGPAPTPAKDLTHCGPFPLSAVTSARLLRVTTPPGSSADRGKTSCPQQLAQPSAPPTRSY